MTDFSYVTINGPESGTGFYEFQQIKRHPIEISAPHVDAPKDEPTTPAPDPVVVDIEAGVLWGTASADEFTFDHLFDGGWIVNGFEPGKDKLMLDHRIFGDLPLGPLNASLIWQDGNDPAEVPAGVPLFFDQVATLAYNGHDLAIFNTQFGPLSPSDIIIF